MLIVTAYNPATVVKLLDIFRVAYNYMWPGQDGQTPAMRLGTLRMFRQELLRHRGQDLTAVSTE